MNTKKRRMKSIIDAVIQWKGFPVIAGAVGAFFAPIWAFLLGMLALVLINRRLGKRAAIARKEPITDAGSHKSFSTVLDYCELIIAGHICDVWFISRVQFLSETELVATTAATLCAAAELSKIVRNVRTLRGIQVGKLKGLLELLEEKKEPNEDPDEKE
jgi:hypothetical protein